HRNGVEALDERLGDVRVAEGVEVEALAVLARELLDLLAALQHFPLLLGADGRVLPLGRLQPGGLRRHAAGLSEVSPTEPPLNELEAALDGGDAPGPPVRVDQERPGGSPEYETASDLQGTLGEVDDALDFPALAELHGEDPASGLEVDERR